ncbi:MAG: radical SAM protein [Acidobacteriota bacterium]|nr:radical SAM protein [Acidobacteriota bacterium]
MSSRGPDPGEVSGSSAADYSELRRKLAWRGDGPARGRFLSVFMDQNNRCNLKCRMCGFSDERVAALKKYDMPRALFESIAEQVFPRTNFLVLSILTEPFMTRDFPDRLAAVHRHGVPYSEIITNGTLLDEANIAKTIDAGITCLTVSIDGGTKEIYEAVRAGATFQAVMYNVGLFQSMRRSRRVAMPALRINHVLSEINIDHFEAFLGLVRRIRPEKIGVRTVSRMSNALIQENRDPEFWEKVRAARTRLADFCRMTGIEDAGFLRDRPTPIELTTDRGEKMICRAPWEALAIHPDGDVYPCMAWTRSPVGNLARQSFDEIWNGEGLSALRAEFEGAQPGVDCLNCSIRRDAAGDLDDDFFYRKIAKQPTA